ncbi:hypothetical protein CSW98_14645 [Vibrio sp. HA2012]|nr:hypothetical protein CSW98_14645 [Vibrio sp. HA2012]
MVLSLLEMNSVSELLLSWALMVVVITWDRNPTTGVFEGKICKFVVIIREMAVNFPELEL